MKVYTNLDTNNMANEIRVHLKNVTNKEYIKRVLEENYVCKFITKDEYKTLKQELLDDNMYCCLCGKRKDLEGLDEYEGSMCHECFVKEFEV